MLTPLHSHTGKTPMPLRSRATVLRGAIGLTVAIVLIVVLWVALTKPARTNPSPSWQTALSLAEEGARKAILELQTGEGEAAETEQGDRTLIYSNLKTVPQGGTGSCRVTVCETPPLAALIEATGIVHDGYRTLAQRTLQVTVQRKPFFESAAFARKELLVAPGAGVEGLVSTNERSPSNSAWLAENHREEEPLPLLLPPWDLPSTEAVMLSGGDVLTLSGGGVFPIVSLMDSSRLIIADGAALHIAGPLILRGESRIVVACPFLPPAGDGGVRGVSVYVEKDVLVEGEAAIVNLAKSPLTLSIIGMERHSVITLSTQEPLYATVYAPNSVIRIGPQGLLHGSLCGDVVEVLPGTRVYYDERLASAPSPLRPFAVVSVRER